MNNLTYGLGLVLILSLWACSASENNFDPCSSNNARDLVLTIEDEFTSPPSRVSVFFKLEDKNGLPIAGLSSSNFTVYEKGRNDSCPREISEFESRQIISNKSRVFAYQTLLILDLSASVTATSLEELKVAAANFVESVMPQNESASFTMGIYWFDGEDELHVLSQPTSNKTILQNSIAAIDANISDDPSTDLYGAVLKGVDIAEATLSTNAQNDILSAVSIMVFTDGTDQAGRYLKSDALNTIKNANSGIKFFSIGLGNEIDEPILQDIGTDGFAFAADQTQLEATFQTVADIIIAEANSYYLFEYCSPKRDGSGINELRIETTLDGLSGFVETEFNATGFVAGCQ